MMAEQSEFFASTKDCILMIGKADQRPFRTAGHCRKKLRLLFPINLAYDVHAGSHGYETEAPYNGPAFGMRGGTT
jgi:hypothetical protein